MPVRKRKSVIGLLLVLVLIPILLITTGLVLSLPQEDGEIHLPSLQQSVDVQADKLGIPSITAANRNDAYQVLGFLHARDRLFQMDLMRRNSAGRLAEIFGTVALPLDRQQREYQFEHATQQILAVLPSSHLQVLTAYASGVNAFIDQTKLLPPEFIALRYQPELWRAEDSLLVALGMFQTLNGQEQDERMVTVMGKALPKALVSFLTPDTDEYATALLGGTKSHRPTQSIPVSDFAALNSPNIKLTDNGVKVDNSIAGSNNWVVAGNKTVKGAAMLANDMHLALNVPNIWYRAELRYAQHTLNGVTLPGLPLMIVGSNAHVAWGFTNATADLLDLITLEINPNNQNQYLTPTGWQNFTTTTERIKIKDGHDLAITLKSTLWGPVSTKTLLGKPVVIKWTALDAKAVDLGLLEMDAVSSVKQAMTVINQAGGPAQNVVFADDAGHIGWTYMGRFPKRQGFDGLVSQSWANGINTWNGFISPQELPRLYDPPEGFIVTANNRTLGSDYPYILGYNWALSYRAYRIHELLQNADKLTEQDILAMQLDTRSELYDFYQKLALQYLDKASVDADKQQIKQAILTWDGNFKQDSKGIALLRLFRAQLAEHVFAKVVTYCRQYDKNFNYAWREIETPLRQLLTEQPPGILPAQYKDDWSMLILETLQTAAKTLQTDHPNVALTQLTWGSVNQIIQRHPFSQTLPALSAVLDIAHFTSAGCASVCVKTMSNEHGASERLVVAPAHPETGILEMPGGQSGHPLSPHYRDQQPFWQQGQTSSFLPGKPSHTLHFQAQ